MCSLSMEASDVCVVCSQIIEEAPSPTLTGKGCRGVNQASETRTTRLAVYPGKRYIRNAGENFVTQGKYPKLQMRQNSVAVLWIPKVMCSNQQRKGSFNVTLIALFMGNHL